MPFPVFLFVRQRGGERERFWKCLAGLVALSAGRGSFDFANRFKGRIGLLRSGRQLGWLVTARGAGPQALKRGCGWTDYWHEWNSCPSRFSCSSGNEAGRERFWKCLAGLVAHSAGKGSFDFANRFKGRIGLLRSGRQLGWLVTARQAGAQALKRGCGWTDYWHEWNSCPSRFYCSSGNEAGKASGFGNALRGLWSSRRVRGPSTSQTDSKGESVCCAQEDRCRGLKPGFPQCVLYQCVLYRSAEALRHPKSGFYAALKRCSSTVATGSRRRLGDGAGCTRDDTSCRRSKE